MLRHSRTPCRNGPGCYFLKNRRCNFYHPSHHLSQNNRTTNISSPLQIRQGYTDYFSNLNSQFMQMMRQVQLRQQAEQQRIAQRARIRESLLQRQRQRDRLSSLRMQNLLQNLMIQRNQRLNLTSNKEQFSWFLEKNNIFYIKNSSTQTLKKLENFSQCPICFEDFIPKQQVEEKKEEKVKEEKVKEDQKQLIQLYCNHIYHKDCIQNWLKKNPKCGVCRKDFRNHEIYEKWDKDYKKKFKLPQQYPIIRNLSTFSPPTNTIPNGTYVQNNNGWMFSPRINIIPNENYVQSNNGWLDIESDDQDNYHYQEDPYDFQDDFENYDD